MLIVDNQFVLSAVNSIWMKENNFQERRKTKGDSTNMDMTIFRKLQTGVRIKMFD